MDCVVRALAKKITQWKEDLEFARKFRQQKLTKYYTGFSDMAGMLLVSADFLNLLWKLEWFNKRDPRMDINPEGQTSESTQSQKTFLNYVENEQSTKHRRFHLTERESIPSNNVISSANAPTSGQSG